MTDSDIKIYYSKNDTRGISKEFQNVFESMNFHRLNGNLAKAKEFGVDLAQAIINSCDAKSQKSVKELFVKKFQTQAIMLQVQVLLVFAVEAALHHEIKSTEIVTTILNSMYDEIKKVYPNFYKNISDGAAFTFYYVAIGQKGDIGFNVGEAFAMLCGVKNAEDLVPSAKEIWLNQAAYVHEEIKKCGFQLG